MPEGRTTNDIWEDEWQSFRIWADQEYEPLDWESYAGEW